VPLLPRFASVWRNLFRKAGVERDLDDELRAYVELLAEEKMRAGVPAEAARRAARVEAGVERVKEEVREVRAGAWIESVAGDIRYALRGLRRSPGFAVTAVGSVGLAIGASTIVFTWTERLLLRPLPAVPESERVVRMQIGGPAGDLWGVSYPDYLAWRDGTRSFEGIAAQTMVELGFSVGGRRVRVWGAATSWNLFEVLRLRPALGRTFRPEDETAAAPKAVISHRLWRSLFHGDSLVVGRHIEINGHDATVIGVAPFRFAGADAGLNVDVWILAQDYELVSCSPGTVTSRTGRIFAGFARLRPGMTVEEARRDVTAVQQRVAGMYQESRGTTAVVTPVQGWHAALWLPHVSAALLAVTLVVVLVACANVANLLLARAASRQREIGIRLAVGAGRARLVRQWLLESGVLALGGGTLGLLLAVFGKELILPAPASDLPIGSEIFIDVRVVAFTLALTGAATLLIGLVPALRASKVDLVTALRGGAAGGASGRGRLESALIVSQVALSLVSLVFAGLFVRGAQRVLAADTGMRDPHQVLLFNQRLYIAGYTCATGPAFTERMLARVRAVPGVRTASVATFVPLGVSSPMAAPGVRAESDSGPVVESGGVSFSGVGADYFETVGTPIVRGRGITRADGPAPRRVAVVNESFARRFWPGADPLGRRIHFFGAWWEVVGVARDARYTRLEGPVQPFVYLPMAQYYWPDFALLVRTGGDPRALGESLRRALAELDPRLPYGEGRTLVAHIEASTWEQRLGAWTLGTTGALALFLCAVGLYGMLAYTVAQRTREFGVRIAIGARAMDVFSLVVGPVMRLTWIGLALGVALAFGAERLLRNRMLGVGPPDAIVVGAVAALLAAVALLAAWLPARRAARVNPVIALEAE
jgi:predicted permease